MIHISLDKEGLQAIIAKGVHREYAEGPCAVCEGN